MKYLNKTAILRDINIHLSNIYTNNLEDTSIKIFSLLERYSPFIDNDVTGHTERWNEEDVMLITYGDSIVNKEQIPLQTLHDFTTQRLNDTFSSIHILPFFPYSSDDGFSVIDFRAVNDQLGNWEDINRITKNSKLMVDLVINHVSRESLWFYDFVANQSPASDYFIELPAETDVSMVTRPRSSPLLVPVNTHRGTRHLWATFSEDQIDLDF